MKNNVTPIAAAARQATGPEAAAKQDDFHIEAAGQPEDRPELAYGRAQVAALVIVQGQSVASIPPQVFASVVLKDSPEEIVALVGPEKDLASVRDAILFANAFKLRDALRNLADKAAQRNLESDTLDGLATAILQAQQALDDCSPQFLAVTPAKTAEQRLAEATANYDPSQTPSTAGILGDVASTIVSEQGHDGPGGLASPASPADIEHAGVLAREAAVVASLPPELRK